MTINHKVEVVESYPLTQHAYGISFERHVHAECSCGWRSTQHGYTHCRTLCPCMIKVSEEGYNHYEIIEEANFNNKAFTFDPHRGEVKLGLQL